MGLGNVNIQEWCYLLLRPRYERPTNSGLIVPTKLERKSLEGTSNKKIESRRRSKKTRKLVFIKDEYPHKRYS